MARKPSIFRQLALAKALAEGTPEREIARRFAEEWQLQRDTIHVMLKKLLRTWLGDPSKTVYKSLSPWKTSAKARARMQVLAEALANGEARGDVVRKYAEEWGLTATWVDELITRVLVENQAQIHEEAQRELAIYIARLRAFIDRYQSAQDFPASSETYERLTRLKSLDACTTRPTKS